MRFTWWTYWVAMHRAKKAETLEFQHGGRSCKKHTVFCCWEFTEALARRKSREGR